MFSFLSTSMGDRVEQLKTIMLKAIKSVTSKKASEVIDKFPLSLDKRETSGTVPQPGPSTSQSDIELSLSDADSGFVEQSVDISQNKQQAVPGTDLSTSVPVLCLNRVDDCATTSTTDGTGLNVPDLSTSVLVVDLKGVDDGVTTSTTDANSVAEEHDGKFGIDSNIGQSQEGPIDVNANGIMCINDSQNAMIIDEKDIGIGRELEVETVTDKIDMDKEGKFGFNVNVHSTPVTKEYGVTDSGEFINSSKREYGNGCFVHDLTNNTKFTVKSDGLVFGGPDILSTPLERHTHSLWRKVNIWNVPDIAYKYVGDSIPLHKEYLYGLKEKEDDFDMGGDYGLPAVEGTRGKCKLDSDTRIGIGTKRKRRCCILQ